MNVPRTYARAPKKALSGGTQPTILASRPQELAVRGVLRPTEAVACGHRGVFLHGFTVVARAEESLSRSSSFLTWHTTRTKGPGSEMPSAAPSIGISIETLGPSSPPPLQGGGACVAWQVSCRRSDRCTSGADRVSAVPRLGVCESLSDVGASIDHTGACAAWSVAAKRQQEERSECGERGPANIGYRNGNRAGAHEGYARWTAVAQRERPEAIRGTNLASCC